eukprot:TRINITY_DN762_c0_g1_i2.p1 TRINITY_DN762_c0_g1~~TRINITY_DN762_c0_g1_i2.p1  ORF type:complete len:68 (-),score=0.80 TRINITY_DN762_c0_g1_i2:15-218(-)
MCFTMCEVFTKFRPKIWSESKSLKVRKSKLEYFESFSYAFLGSLCQSDVCFTTGSRNRLRYNHFVMI